LGRKIYGNSLSKITNIENTSSSVIKLSTKLFGFRRLAFGGIVFHKVARRRRGVLAVRDEARAHTSHVTARLLANQLTEQLQRVLTLLFVVDAIPFGGARHHLVGRQSENLWREVVGHAVRRENDEVVWLDVRCVH